MGSGAPSVTSFGADRPKGPFLAKSGLVGGDVFRSWASWVVSRVRRAQALAAVLADATQGRAAASTPTDAPIVVPHATLNTAALAVALAAAHLATTGRLERGALPWVTAAATLLLLTTLLTSLHMPQVRPSQPPSSLPLLIFLHSVLFVNAYVCGSCCAVSAAWPCGASGFEPHSCPVPTQGGSYLFSMIADILFKSIVGGRCGRERSNRRRTYVAAAACVTCTPKTH